MNALTHTTTTSTTTTAGRTGLRSAISPWGRQHPRAVAGIRFAVGLLLTVISLVALDRGLTGVTIVLLAVAALHFGLGSWALITGRSALPHHAGH